MNQEQYIEHEVKLRVNDHRFKSTERELSRLNNKLNFIIITMVTSVLLPVILHHYRMI